MNQDLALRIRRAQAKILAAKTPLEKALPFISTFLMAVPIHVEEVPEVFPAYVTPTEVVVGLQAVEELSLPELRTLLTHEGFHPALGVFDRCGDRDWDLFVTAHDLVINGMIQAEITHLNVQNLNGQGDPSKALLRWSDKEGYQPLLVMRFHGKSVDEVYQILKDAAERGENPYPVPRDIPRPDPQAIQDGTRFTEVLRHALIQAGLEASKSGWGDSSLVDLVLAEITPKTPWQAVLAQSMAQRMDQWAEQSYFHPSPRDWDREDGLLTPGPCLVGQSLVIAADVSRSSLQGQEGRTAASPFLAEVQAGLLHHDGPVRVMLWDQDVRLDRVVSPGESLTSLLGGIRGGAGTNLFALLGHLQSGRQPVGDELPEPGLLVLLTDGKVSEWPPFDAWPCDVLVVYTLDPPPPGYAAIHLKAA